MTSTEMIKDMLERQKAYDEEVLKTVYVSWFGNPKDITIAELKAINKQCEELNWLG